MIQYIQAQVRAFNINVVEGSTTYRALVAESHFLNEDGFFAV